MTTCSGTITDGSGSKNYTNDLSCSWTITPTNAVAVTLNFTEFNTESGFDFVRVYNGTNANAPLLGEFSGTSLPPTLTANSGKMYLTFTSDELSTRPGWSAGYSCTTAQLSVNPSSFNFSANGGSNSMNLTANCAWSIQNIPSWLMLTPTSGSANATVSVTCAPNTSQQSRSVTLTITGCNGLSQTVTISQSGCAAPSVPTISAGGPTSLCPGETVTLTAANVCGTCTVNWSNGMTGPSISVSSAGAYTATQSNACGQSTTSNSIAVSVGQAPAAPTITAGGPTSLCPGEIHPHCRQYLRHLHRQLVKRHDWAQHFCCIGRHVHRHTK
ncbi:MAG: hypothetical protein IPM36_07540 [Lewinellaceae bacterium]|nr:hypothetical protein [Lewinellaceae bacterium]